MNETSTKLSIAVGILPGVDVLTAAEEMLRIANTLNVCVTSQSYDIPMCIGPGGNPQDTVKQWEADLKFDRSPPPKRRAPAHKKW